MKNGKRKKCAGLIAVFFLIMSLSACGKKSSMEAVFNAETGGYEVTAENAKETVCTGRITVSGGECLAVSSDLEKGCMIISAYSVEDFKGIAKDGFAEALSEMSEDDEEKAVLNETISGNNVKVYTMDPGAYYIAFTTEDESTSGIVKAMPFSIEELKEQNKDLADTLGKDAPDADSASSSDAAGTAVSTDASGKNSSTDASDKNASTDASDKNASTDAAGKDVSTDASDKNASTDAADKDAADKKVSADASGKDVSTDAADKNTSTDASGKNSSGKGAASDPVSKDTTTDDDVTAAVSDDSGSEIATVIESPASDTENAGVEDGQNPVMGFIGPYTYDRVGMYIEADGGHNARVSVAWGSSAREHSEWFMSGPFDEKTLTITYSNCVRKDVTFNENGDVESETIAYENGTGTITFREGEEASLIWKDNQDHIADDGVFTWSFVPPEE